MERKIVEATDFKFQLEGDGPGSFSGYASTFGNFDRVNERPVKGAFAPHLAEFLKDGFVSASHRWDLYIATPKTAYEDDHGLYVEAEFHSTPAAQEVRTIVSERLARGKSVSLSIGYEVLGARDVEGGRELTDIVLREFSVVTVPANPLANILASKAAVSALPLEMHSETVVSAVEELKGRFVANHAARLKEGRVLSDKNRRRIAALIEELQSLLTETEPKADPETVKRLMIDVLLMEARQNGVRIP